ncbi:hypothetical protein JCM12296A_33260 [Desulfosarcina cetonica]
MYFTHTYVGKSMLEAEVSSVRNILHLVELNIQGGYDKLLSDKMEMVLSATKDLKKASEICVSVANDMANLAENGSIPASLAKEKTLRWLHETTFGKLKIFVFDQEAQMLMHQMRERDVTPIRRVEDVKGRNLFEVMRPDVLSTNGDFAVFYWPSASQGNKKQKMGYFRPLPNWGWTVGAIIDFDEIEAEAKKKVNKIVQVLGRTFSKITISKTGTAFLFHGDRSMLIAPKGTDGIDFQTLKNDLSGNLLLDDLMQAAHTGDKSICYIRSALNDHQLLEAHIRYFKAFDWYIVLVFPVDEIQASAKRLLGRQSLIIGLIFFVSIAAAYVFMSRISDPLKKLALYAQNIPEMDFTTPETSNDFIDKLANKQNDEVGQLAKSFAFMEKELKKNVLKVIETTEQKQRAAEESNRLKSEFLANMSHELRTPLNHIIGFTELALDKHLGDLNEQQEEYLSDVHQSSLHLLSLINDILDLSKVEAGKLSLESSMVEIEPILLNSLVMVKEKAMKNGIRLSTAIEEMPGFMWVDERKIKQILYNLLSNAVKFTEPGGEISLEAYCASFYRDETASDDIALKVIEPDQLPPAEEIDRTEPCVVVRVKDTGIGLKLDDQQRIFEPFEQADGSTSRKYQGTGLGLSLTRKLVQLHGGAIWVHSDGEGHGSTFGFIIPINDNGLDNTDTLNEVSYEQQGYP